MAFTEEQVAALNAPLDAKHVKTRSQGSFKLSYIEGWQAIATANEIFGHDGWSRETLQNECVSQSARKIGQGQSDGWGVTYIARVSITVARVTRDGYGTGHGIDRDLGLAHESAIKEAETDATKRALMTFGWPFGLALYDKSQEHVATVQTLPKAKARELYAELQAEAREQKTPETLRAWWKANDARIATLPQDWQGQLLDECKRLTEEGKAA